MTDKLHDDLTRNLNALRAAASRGPVTSREIFQMTDGMMDLLSRAALAAAPQPAPEEGLGGAQDGAMLGVIAARRAQA